MEEQKRPGKLYGLWLSFTIKQKLSTFAGAIIITIGLAIVSYIITINYALYGFGPIMEENVESYEFLEAVGEEAKAFEAYARSGTKEYKEAYELACIRTKKAVEALPYDYKSMGATRYARTWSIRNFYVNYVKERDYFLILDEAHPEYVSTLYQVYRLQEYLDNYARRLMNLTMQSGNDSYLARVPVLHRIPVILLIVGVCIITMIVMLTMLMWNSMITPINQLAGLSRKIARNEFPKDDIAVENRDELGELVQTFNKMKHATIGYIGALEEKYEMTQLLHQEELERVEMEKHLEATRLEVLKSQINPHFLFNTLNMIACMAKLEEAAVTDKMINSLGNLFRYNLKTTETEVPLSQELQVVDDYMYLQQMRFGDRIQYEKDIRSDVKDTIIPSFSLQPIVENAILHGLSSKEQGGKIFIRAVMRRQYLLISVMDTGVGIHRDSLIELRSALAGRQTARIGIGLGNIYKRLHMMYKDADLQIFSKAGVGTIIQMKLPQKQ